MIAWSRRSAPVLGFLPITGTFGLATPRRVELPLPQAFWDLSILGRLGAPRLRAMKPTARASAFYAPARQDGQPHYDLSALREQLLDRNHDAVILVGTLGLMHRLLVARLTGPQYELVDRVTSLPRSAPIIAVTPGFIDQLGPFGNLARMRPPEEQEMSIRFGYDSHELPLAAPARNVVAMIPGSDPELRSEYIILSAHADHLGIATDIDRIGTDSIFNGANDGSTGSVALLAIAERIMSATVKPKRSIVFVWTVGESKAFSARNTSPIARRCHAKDRREHYDRRHRTRCRERQCRPRRSVPRVAHAWRGFVFAARGHRGCEPANDSRVQIDHRAHNNEVVCAGDDWHFTGTEYQACASRPDSLPTTIPSRMTSRKSISRNSRG